MNSISLPERVETERLMLQRLKYEDAEEIFYTYASKSEATKYLPWATHRRVEDTRAFLMYVVSAWEQGLNFAYGIRLKHNSRLIGSFGVVNNDLNMEFGYVLSPTQWGRGYATEACVKMMNILKSNTAVKKISTFVDAENVASVKVLQKAGLIHEGTFSNWFKFVNQNMEARDCVLMHLPL
jgi:[ribosomal protein S5]-alanine N-acetyltransferase